MAKKEFTCIVCPRGCRLTVDENLNVTGNTCPRGAEYGRQEASDPRRVLTSTVRIEGAILRMCPVRTASPIPKGKIKEAMEEIRKTTISAPISIGDVIIEDVAGTGIPVVAARDMERIDENTDR
jgi:CxxC motif-containing protein